jgi:hypothetical protein
MKELLNVLYLILFWYLIGFVWMFLNAIYLCWGKYKVTRNWCLIFKLGILSWIAITYLLEFYIKKSNKESEKEND